MSDSSLIYKKESVFIYTIVWFWSTHVRFWSTHVCFWSIIEFWVDEKQTWVDQKHTFDCWAKTVDQLMFPRHKALIFPFLSLLLNTAFSFRSLLPLTNSAENNVRYLVQGEVGSSCPLRGTCRRPRSPPQLAKPRRLRLRLLSYSHPSASTY